MNPNFYKMTSKYSTLLGPAIVGLLIIIALLAYVKVFNAEFVYDDYAFIVNNKDIQSFKPFSKFFLSPDIFTGSNYSDQGGGKNWRPVASFAFAAQYALFGKNPFGYHLTSIFFHILNLVLVYFLVMKLTKRVGVATLTAAFWALHPAATEAVSWVANQSSLIFFGFFILAILAVLKYNDNRNKKFFLWVSYFFFILSLLTKETALGGIFIFPFIFLLIYKEREINFKKIAINSLPFILIGLAYFYARYKIIGSLGDHALRGGFLDNILLAPMVFYKYVSLSVYPVNLLLNYANLPLPSGISDPRVISGILLFSVLTFLIYFGFRKFQFNFVIGIVWFLAFLLPVLQIIPFQDIIGERFLYAPLFGFFLSTVLGFEYLLSRVKLRFKLNLNKFALFFIILTLGAFFILTFRRNTDWLNSENLWLSVLKIDNRNGRALQNLSAYYLERGEALKIIEFSNRLIEVSPENKSGLLHLAVGKILNGQYEEAESELLDLIKKYPDFQEAKINLSILYKQLGQMSSETDSFIESVIISPEVEGNIITSGIFGEIVLNVAPYEASLDVLSGDGIPVISVRSHSNGAFQIPLKPGFYVLKPVDPDGPIKPAQEKYPINIGTGRWLQLRLEYK